MVLIHKGNLKEQNRDHSIELIYVVHDDVYSRIWEHNLKRRFNHSSIKIYKASIEEIKKKYNYQSPIYPVIYIFKDGKLLGKKYGYLNSELIFKEFTQI